jgi:ATP-dependent helicase HrpB
MVVDAATVGAAELAAEIAVVLTERGLGGNEVDLGHRREALRGDRSPRAREARAMAKRWAQIARRDRRSGEGRGDEPSVGALLALAYPDRVAKNRGAGGGFQLANGRGVNIDPASPLARAPFLAVAEIAGGAAQGRIVLAALLTLAEIEAQFSDRIEGREEIAFDEASASLRARRLRRLGALALSEQPIAIVPDAASPRMLAHGVVRLGVERLPWTTALRQWRDRVLFLRRTQGKEWPDLSDDALAASAGDWLAAALSGKTALSEFTSGEFAQALQAFLPWALRRRLDAEAPSHFGAPSGSAVPIDYAAPEGPRLAIRLQELFGLDRHPTVAAGRVPLVLELLSPAHRPVQVTRDLPGFWRGSYGAVRAEMRGRYPRHPWPDDPLAAMPTRRAKPRSS